MMFRLMKGGYLDGTDRFDGATGDYAFGYADQVEREYATFVKAVRSGRIKNDSIPDRLEAALG